MNALSDREFRDFAKCPHGPRVSEGKEAMWSEDSSTQEQIILEKFGDVLNVAEVADAKQDRVDHTLAAMQNKVPIIMNGELTVEGLSAQPHALVRLENGEYMPYFVQNVMAFDSELKPEWGFAMKFAVSVECLRHLGFATHMCAKLIDNEGRELDYNYNSREALHTRYYRFESTASWWERYEALKKEKIELDAKRRETKAAVFDVCHFCDRRDECKEAAQEQNLISQIKRMDPRTQMAFNSRGIVTISDLAGSQLEDLIDPHGASLIMGLNAEQISSILTRSKLIESQAVKPEKLREFELPECRYIIHYDMETEPRSGRVFMHGILVEDRETGTKVYKSFISKEDSNESEERAWSDFLTFLNTLEDDYKLIVYSNYEQAQIMGLARRYPDVMPPNKAQRFCENSLFDLKKTVSEDLCFPTFTDSLKVIAPFFGFAWRGRHPNGSQVPAWYRNYLQTGDKEIMQKTLNYNEDDVDATDCIWMRIAKMSSNYETIRERFPLAFRARTR